MTVELNLRVKKYMCHREPQYQSQSKSTNRQQSLSVNEAELKAATVTTKVTVFIYVHRVSSFVGKTLATPKLFSDSAGTIIAIAKGIAV